MLHKCHEVKSFALSAILISTALHAQVIQFSREQLIEYTKENPFERSADGRPRVPDDLLKKLQDVSAEELWAVLARQYFNDQFEGHWRILHPEKHLVGRAVTAQFMPLRPDVQATAEAKANGDGPKRNANQRVIDSLTEGEAIVVDLYGKEKRAERTWETISPLPFRPSHIQEWLWTARFVTSTASLKKGMPGCIRGAHPTPISDCMLTGVNMPIRIGQATVVPGDVVFGHGEGVYFIPPQFVKEIVENAEELHVHDVWTQMMLKTGKYRSSEIYPTPKNPELKKQYDEYKRQHLGH